MHMFPSSFSSLKYMKGVLNAVISEVHMIRLHHLSAFQFKEPSTEVFHICIEERGVNAS
jgi:hypothetical protein